MPLEPGDIFTLTKALNDSYANIADFSMVLAGAGRSIDNYSAASELNRARIFKSVDAADREGWVALLLTSIEQDSVAGRPRFQQGHSVLKEVARVRALLNARATEIGLAAGGDPANALIVFRRPFMDRKTFRLDLGRFAGGNESRVFMVKGPPSCGKSHSWYFIRHYCQTKTKANLALVDLSERNPDACRPRDLMGLLADQMGLDPRDMPTDGLAQDARIAEKLTSWLIRQSGDFEQKGKRWWIGFDGLDRPQATQGVRDLVSRLALEIERGVLKNTWLFLFGFNDALPAAIDSYVFREVVTELSRSELRRYLRDLFEVRGGAIDDRALDRLVDFVFDGLSDPLRPEGIPAFQNRLHDVMQRSLAQGGR